MIFKLKLVVFPQLKLEVLESLDKLRQCILSPQELLLAMISITESLWRGQVGDSLEPHFNAGRSPGLETWIFHILGFRSWESYSTSFKPQFIFKMRIIIVCAS